MAASARDRLTSRRTGRSRPWTGERPLRIVIAGGGTGGHVLPAVAVLEELTARQIAVECLWVGSPDSVEAEAAAKAGARFRGVQTGKLRRYRDLRNATDAVRIPVGVVQAGAAIRRFHPDVILSTGGFVSVPSVIGCLRAAPVITHEQTAILGLATRINLRFGATLAVSYAETAAGAKGMARRIEVTGNPIRRSLQGGDAGRGQVAFGFTTDLPVLTVMGGARGASPINQRVEAMLPGLLELTQVVHQTGPVAVNGDLTRLKSVRQALPEQLRSRYVLREFIRDELPDVYAMTSLVLARAGAGTVAELAGLGLPSVLIPLPHAGGDEQVRNAEVLSRAGATVIVREPDATPERLREIIAELLGDPARLQRMSDAAIGAGATDAASRLADLLIELGSTP